MNTLRQAAQAVIDRWDAPLWKDIPATAVYMGALRAALEAPEQEHDDLKCARRKALDDAARLIYESWKYIPEYRPWTDGGNSLKNCEARRIAKQVIGVLAQPVAVPVAGLLGNKVSFGAPDKRDIENGWIPLTPLNSTQQVAAPDIKVLQAKYEFFLQNVQLLEIEVEDMTKERDDLKGSVLGLNRYSAEVNARNATLTKERDEYQKAADDMAADHKIERDALLAAGHIALDVMAMYQVRRQDFDTFDDAIKALKQAGVSA